MALGITEQAFLQRLMACKAMTATDALKYYNKCEKVAAAAQNRTVKKVQQRYQLDQKLENITKKLAPNGFMLRCLYSPWEKKSFWVLVNTIDDESSKVANVFSKVESEIFFVLINALLESNGSIIKNDAFHIAQEGHSLNMSDCEAIILKFEKKHWFVTIRNASNDAIYVFGPRCIAELPRIRNFARQLSTNGAAKLNDDGEGDDAVTTGAAGRGGGQGDDGEEEEEEEEVIVSRSSRRSSRSLPRMSQEHEMMDIENGDGMVRDQDEDEEEEEEEIQPAVRSSQRNNGQRSRKRNFSQR